jgi:hypothetical protein
VSRADIIDRAERLLRTLGWYYGDWWTDSVRTVYAHRDADKIIPSRGPICNRKPGTKRYGKRASYSGRP